MSRYIALIMLLIACCFCKVYAYENCDTHCYGDSCHTTCYTIGEGSS